MSGTDEWPAGVLSAVETAIAVAVSLPANEDKKMSEIKSAAVALFGGDLVAAVGERLRASVTAPQSDAQ